MSMARPSPAPQKRDVIDALVLAFSHSKLRSVVGTDALRSVLDVEYRDMLSGNVFDLGPLWELLEEQPGFDAALAAPPMCQFKTWERRLGLEVAMPAALADLKASEIIQRAAECPIPTKELQALFRGNEAGSPKEALRASQKTAAVAAEHGVPAPVAAHARRRKTIFLVATVIAVAGLGFAGVYGYRAFNVTPKWTSITAAGFPGDLPAADAERLGDQVGARLTDPGWLARPEAERREQLAAGLRALADQGVTVLFLRDDTDRVRALVQRQRDGSHRYDFR
jgi:hypothetical protein